MSTEKQIMHEQVLQIIIKRCQHWERESDSSEMEYSKEQLADAVVQLETEISSLREAIAEKHAALDAITTYLGATVPPKLAKQCLEALAVAPSPATEKP